MIHNVSIYKSEAEWVIVQMHHLSPAPHTSSPIADFSGLILQLYKLSHDMPIELFQDSALRLLKPVLPFDASMWGTATATAIGIDVHTLHLHENRPR